MKALIKYPGKASELRDINDTLEELQGIVGGYIEAVTLTSDCVIVCNEEGRLMDLPYNWDICGISFVGPILLLGVKGEEFDDFPMTNEEAADIGLVIEKENRNADAIEKEKRLHKFQYEL